MKARKGGFTVMEVIVASVVLGIALTSLIGGITNLNKLRHRSQGLYGRDKQIAALLESVRSNVRSYRATFTDADAMIGAQSATEAMLDVAQLPMAWSNTEVTTVALCPKCPGRYGYVIQPFAVTTSGVRVSVPGLYLVTVRVTNSELFTGFKDYSMIVGAK